MFRYLVLAGAAVQLAGKFSYVKETVRGNTKPNRVTWLMWSVAPLVATFAAVADGVTWAALPVFMSGFASLAVFAASFANPRAYWKLERFDYLCGLCSILAIILWGVTREPFVAIVFAIASDGFAATPTLVKSWNHPETETVHAYTAGLFNALTSFTAVVTWNFSSYAFPAYLVALNALLIFAIYRRKLGFLDLWKT